MNREQMRRIVEAALFAADEPVSIDRLVGLFTEAEIQAAQTDAAEVQAAAEASTAPENPTADAKPLAPAPRALVREALAAIDRETEGRGYELAQVASGYRFQVRQALSPWVSRLFAERPPRYSRALLETLALIVYRQPITRGEVEEVRGVAVSASIMRTLLERGWIRAVGQRETPGRPTMYGTTRAFLDYFNLRSLGELPPLEEIKSVLGEEPPEEAAPDVGAEGDEAEAPAEPEADAVDNQAADAPAETADAANVVRLPAPDGANRVE